jgi:hypothetical protein
MALETGTYINSLVATNPTGSDAKSAGDDHLRLIKSTLKSTFPSVTGAVSATHTELNLLDGVTATTAELNYTDGVTSNIQTQLGTKQATLVNIADATTANGYGTRTVSTSAPSGGSNGDVHYQV